VVHFLAAFYIREGYVKKGDYTFPEKHLTACHYEHP